MNKPQEQTHKYYNLEDIISYLEKKYNITPDLWDWLCQTLGPNADSEYRYLNIDTWLTYWEEIPEQIKSALLLMKEEFCAEDTDALSIHVNWQ